MSTQTAKLPGEGRERSPQEISPRMFDNPVLEWGSRVHPIVPPLIYIPVISFLLSVAVNARDLNGFAILGVFVLGILFWSFFEYTLHRFIFHLRPDNEWGRKMHFIIHGVHHDFPHDPMRLVMPPAVSVPLAILMYFVFRGVLGPDWSLPAFAGFLLGYLIYDMGHYHIHHHRSNNKLSLALRRYHYRHHFQQSDRGFGVTSPVWDRVFRTSPMIRRRRSAKS